MVTNALTKLALRKTRRPDHTLPTPRAISHASHPHPALSETRALPLTSVADFVL